MSAKIITKETVPNWELHHCIFWVKIYYKCGSAKKISERFHTFFEIDRELHKSVIQDWVSKFETYGTTVNINKKSSGRFSHSGRPRTRTQQIVEMVQESVERSPKSIASASLPIFEFEHVNWQKSYWCGFEQISISYTDKK